MAICALLAETRRGPRLPDLILEQFSPVHSLDWMNATFWMLGLLSGVLYLCFRHRREAVAYFRVGAAVSVIRGIFILLTSLGPVGDESGSYFNAGFTAEKITTALVLRQILPVDVLWGGSAYSAAYLTQDLFFSGHTASTLLLLLVHKQWDWFRMLALAFHLIVVAVLFLTHEHYSIDIFGAYFITYAIWRFMQNRGWTGN